MGVGQTVPVIDVALFLAGDPVGTQEVVRQVGHACETIGFLVLTGHGIDPALQARTFQAYQTFFDLPEAEKLRYHAVPGTYLGYNPVGSERVAYSRGEKTPPDLNENFTNGRIETDDRDPYYTSAAGKRIFTLNVWPEQPAHLQAVYTEYYRATERLAKAVLEMFALALQLPLEYFGDKVSKSMDFLRALNYPALTTSPQPNQFRSGPHTDYGILTLVMADGPGLQVQTARGDWEDVPYVPGCMQVNIGDMMAQWTNDRWVSTLHRVVVPGGSPEAMSRRRMALAFFLTCNYDVVIEPMTTCCSPSNPSKYAPVTAGDYFFARVSRQFSSEGDVSDDIRERVAQQ